MLYNIVVISAMHLYESVIIHDIVQETGIKTIPIEKKCKKAKWLSEEALQIAVKKEKRKAKEKRKDIGI